MHKNLVNSKKSSTFARFFGVLRSMLNNALAMLNNATLLLHNAHNATRRRH